MKDNKIYKFIPFEKVGFFSDIILDYIKKSKDLSNYYSNFPDLEGFKLQMEIKKKFSLNRKVLVDELKNQYKNFSLSSSTKNNLELLSKTNTFTVTTGHQLNLFTGPIYFFYKIISTINLAEKLKKEFPNKNFVPVYWLASEDHDFEEINHFYNNDKKFCWNSNQKGAVGNFSTEGLQEVFTKFSSELNSSKNANYLRNLFKEAYFDHDNLSDATRFIVNKIFKEYGLIIIDANSKKLKNEFIPYMKKELLEQNSYKQVSKTIKDFPKNYKIQVNPREINLFYLTNNLRERIILEGDTYKVNNSNICWSKKELIDHLHDFPERFSPNVIMRPLFQEVILPNICYIGGGGELSYWLELKKYFDTENVPFPILLLRNSVQIISKKQSDKLYKLNISDDELFYNQDKLIAEKIIENSELEFNFIKQKQVLENLFLSLFEIAKKTDKSFIGAVKAQEKKQLKGLENLKKRWLRAEKKNQTKRVNQIIAIQNELLPNQKLEERYLNFSKFYQEYGEEFIITLKQNLDPLKLQFLLLKMP